MIETILDPTDERMPMQRTLATRPKSIIGPIGLLDIGKPRGDVFLDRLAELLRGRLDGVELRRYRKPTYTKPAPEGLRLSIAADCAYVIEALGD